MIPDEILAEYPYIGVNEVMNSWWGDFRQKLTDMGLVEEVDYCRYSYRPKGAQWPTGKLAVCFKDQDMAIIASLKWA